MGKKCVSCGKLINKVDYDYQTTRIPILDDYAEEVALHCYHGLELYKNMDELRKSIGVKMSNMCLKEKEVEDAIQKYLDSKKDIFDIFEKPSTNHIYGRYTIEYDDGSNYIFQVMIGFGKPKSDLLKFGKNVLYQQRGIKTDKSHRLDLTLICTYNQLFPHLI